MRKSIATVSVSGTLTEKLEAIAAAGFDGVEIFEPDLLACPLSPEEVRRRARDLGLSIDLYQPFRDFEAMPEPDLRRAERKFQIMERLGADLLLVCSNVSPRCVDDDDLAAEQLHLLADKAAGHGVRVAYEALAWGRHVNEYLRSWRIVRRAGHPNLGVCLDSFHILSRGSDPVGVEAIPGEKIFFVQLADAPLLAMDVLQWSRHHRCFPGQGTFDLTGFLEHVRNAGYAGPLSLEVFNDHFRQADAGRTAVDAMRSLVALEGSAYPSEPPTGFAFAELAVGSGEPGEILTALGFTRTGLHPTKPVELWEQGGARLLLNRAEDRTGETGEGPELAAIGLESPAPAGAVKRAESLLAPVLPRARAAGEARLDAIAAPDGTQIFFCRTARPPSPGAGPTGGAPREPYRWREDFAPTRPATGQITHIDHVALAQPPHHFDEAELFYRSVLGLLPQESLEFPDPYGLLRSKAMTDDGGRVRMVLNVAPERVPRLQHVALACDDILRVARGLPRELVLPIPGNYYDDLAARYEVDPRLRELNVLYDRDLEGEFLHLYTVTVGRVFFEIVQRVGGYQGYGAANAPVRLAVQHSKMRA